MNRQGTFCLALRFIQDAPSGPKAIVLGILPALASGVLTYDAGAKDALGALAVTALVCLTVIPSLFLGTLLTVGRRRRWLVSF